MHELTPRQKLILDKIILEYVRTAKPVSSQLIEQKYGFDIKPATIRREFANLTEAGLVAQPHTSAGRVPTDKAYRLFVNKLLAKLTVSEQQELVQKTNLTAVSTELEQLGSQDELHTLWQLADGLAKASSALVLARLIEDELAFNLGFAALMAAPEFAEQRALRELNRFLEQLGERLVELPANVEWQPRVFIGRECGLLGCSNFSLVVTGGALGQQQAVLALVGPKRMDYARNLRLITKFSELLT